jgi:hypothetical protein
MRMGGIHPRKMREQNSSQAEHIGRSDGFPASTAAPEHIRRQRHGV